MNRGEVTFEMPTQRSGDLFRDRQDQICNARQAAVRETEMPGHKWAD